jgi:hypothetical protein
MSRLFACPDKTVDKCPGEGHVADMSRTNDTKSEMNNAGLVLGFDHYRGAVLTTSLTSSDLGIGQTCVKIHCSAGPVEVDAMLL